MTLLLAIPVGIVALSALLTYMKYHYDKTGARPPPGPKPLPIIGNFLDLPCQAIPEFQHWLKHKDTYGPLSSVSVLGQTLVVIHDKDAARFLLNKKANSTSSRPQLEFGHRMCGYGDLLVLQQYDRKYRLRRRIMHQQLGTKAAVAPYQHIQQVEARRFLLRVLNAPEHLIQHTKTLSAALILKMTYGYSIESNKADPLVTLIEEMLDNLTAAFMPMTWVVDFIPALQHLPDYFPGTAFKQKAREWNKTIQDVANIPYDFVQQQMEARTYRPSYVSRVLERNRQHSSLESKLRTLDNDAVKWTAAMLYGAGSETISSVLASFILAMVEFPEVQRRAQEEIDCLIGTSRLPTLEDRNKLPYIESVVLETYRWFPTIPMGVAHVAEEDIIYSGYLIPKNSYLLPAVWWFCHDPEVYEDPSSFNPDRFLEPGKEPDPRTVIFGFGHRSCPGRYFAESSLFIAIVHILAAFEVTKALDENCVEIEPKVEGTPSLTSHPKEFPYSIKPRSPHYISLIRNIVNECPWEKADASYLK